MRGFSYFKLHKAVFDFYIRLRTYYIRDGVRHQIDSGRNACAYYVAALMRIAAVTAYHYTLFTLKKINGYHALIALIATLV